MAVGKIKGNFFISFKNDDCTQNNNNNKFKQKNQNLSFEYKYVYIQLEMENAMKYS